jgi:hypothetical protein
LVALLHGVRQLVRYEMLARACARLIMARSEDNVAAHRVGQRAYFTRALSRTRIRMHAHVAEIVTEARLHKAARRLVQLFAARLQDIDDGARARWPCRIGRAPLNTETLLATLAARARKASRRAAGTLLLRQQLGLHGNVRPNNCLLRLCHRSSSMFAHLRAPLFSALLN